MWEMGFPPLGTHAGPSDDVVSLYRLRAWWNILALAPSLSLSLSFSLFLSHALSSPPLTAPALRGGEAPSGRGPTLRPVPTFYLFTKHVFLTTEML